MIKEETKEINRGCSYVKGRWRKETTNVIRKKGDEVRRCRRADRTARWKRRGAASGERGRTTTRRRRRTRRTRRTNTLRGRER